MRTHSFILLGALALPLVGCAEEAPATSGAPLPPPDSVGGDGDGDVSSCTYGTDISQDCSCGNGSTGTQYCYEDAKWGECGPCAPQVDPSLPPNKTPCKAGYYTGTFEGTYWPGVADFGAGSVLPVSIEAFGDSTRPGLALTIEEQVGDTEGEFVEYKVGDGCIVGTARAVGGLFGDHPFVAVVQGTLDCSTRVFEGRLRGYYKLFGSDWNWEFEGPLTSLYLTEDPPKLADGQWSVKELQSMAANAPGGEGTWEVGFASETSGELADECATLLANTPVNPTP